MIGYVPDLDLPLLYNCADVFCFPSLYEGFGLPVLEALACGCPVVCSNTSSIPEVAGDAATLLDPTDEFGWSGALAQLFSNPAQRDRMSQRGPARAALFSWEDTAQRTLNVYRAAVQVHRLKTANSSADYTSVGHNTISEVSETTQHNDETSENVLDPDILGLVACPACPSRPRLELAGISELVCVRCGRRYRVREGIPVLVAEESTMQSHS